MTARPYRPAVRAGDFIYVSGGWVWNVADFEIVFGLLGTAAAVVVAATLAYVRGRVVSRG